MRAMLRGIACVCSPNLSTFYSICAKPIHCTSWFHKSSSDSSNGSLNVDFCRVCCLVRFRSVLNLKFLSWFDICACISAVPTKDSIDSLFFDLSALAAIFFSLSFLKFPSCCFHFSFHSRVWTFSKLPLADWIEVSRTRLWFVETVPRTLENRSRLDDISSLCACTRAWPPLDSLRPKRPR